MLGVSEHGIPRLKKMQKERKCLLSIVAGFPFAKQLRTPTPHTHISEEEKRATPLVPKHSERSGVREKPHSQLSGSTLSAHHTSSYYAPQTFWTRGFTIKNNNLPSNSRRSWCASMWLADLLSTSNRLLSRPLVSFNGWKVNCKDKTRGTVNCWDWYTSQTLL